MYLEVTLTLTFIQTKNEKITPNKQTKAENQPVTQKYSNNKRLNTTNNYLH